LSGSISLGASDRSRHTGYVAIQTDLIPVLRSAFPAGLKSDVDAVLTAMPPSLGYERVSGPQVSIGGERIELLSRLYSPEPPDDATRQLNDRQRLILSCLYSRHHDGYVRERHLLRLQGDDPWLPHFVLQLVGEYVIEICQAALDRVDAIPRASYETFAAENEAFVALVRRRIVSYAREYHRSMDFVDYPAYRFMTSLGLWEGLEERRSIRRSRR
jgi:hypothetical protein